MTDREKFVELFTKMFGKTYHPSVIEGFADFLISNGATVQNWIPVTERLPKDDSPVLVYENKYGEMYGNMQTAYYYHYQKRWIGCIGENVTHWAPLPKAPKEKRKCPV